MANIPPRKSLHIMATLPEAGKKAPSFTLPTNGDDKVSLKDFAGKKLVLYFYPKDDTPGCTKEAIGFSENRASFKRAGIEVLGVSKDSVAKHEKFIDKHGLKISLGADEDGKVVEKYGVWVQKNMYGRKYMGIERATFLIDEKGKVAQIWRKVKVPGHVDEVLAAAKAI